MTPEDILRLLVYLVACREEGEIDSLEGVAFFVLKAKSGSASSAVTGTVNVGFAVYHKNIFERVGTTEDVDVYLISDLLRDREEVGGTISRIKLASSRKDTALGVESSQVADATLAVGALRSV
jgi:hypothetical protein